MRPPFLVALFSTFVAIAPAAGQTKVVTPSNMATSAADVLSDPSKWFYFNDENNTIDNTLGAFVSGPGMPPEGTESIEISVSGTQRRNLATYQFSGVPLASLTALGYSTYTPAAGNPGPTNRGAYLQFNVDFDGSDTWQRRLIFLPRDNGTVVQDQWQAWDAIANGNAKWKLSGGNWPGTLTPGSTPRTWSNILASYPGVRVRVSDPWLGIRVGEPYPNGYTTNLDAFVIGTANGTTVFDFDFSHLPTSKNDCMQGGWQTRTRADGSLFPNQGQCIQYVNTGK